MGLYVEVNDKANWCTENGEMVKNPTFEKDADTLICCLIDNVIFYVIGVAYSEDELAVFRESDGRRKDFFKVKKSLLKEVAPEYETYVK
jgi:hypothetical protein